MNKHQENSNPLKTENKIKKNTVFNAIKTISSIVFPLITFPYINRVLHAENVGKVEFGFSVVSYISLIASLGISTYAIRECSRTKNNPDELSRNASQIFSINIITTIISYFILAILLFFWKPLKGYELLIIIQSTTILLTTLGADWLNSAMEDFKYITIRTILFQLIALVSMLIFVQNPDDYLIYAFISIISSSGGNLANIFYRRRYCKVVFNIKIDWKRHLKPILLLFSMILAQQIYVNVDITMIGIMRSDSEVGYYSTATKVYNMVNQVVASIAWVVMPQLSYQFREKNYREINKLLKYAFNFILVLGFPCAVGLLGLSDEIILVIAGEEYIPAAGALRILSFALVGSYISGFIGNIIMLPSGRERICLISSIISAVTNFFLNLVLIPRYGIIAAAWTTAISQWIGFFVKIPYIEKDIKIGPIKKAIVGPVLGCIIICCIIYTFKILVHQLYIRIALTVLFSVSMYAFALLFTRNEFAIEVYETIKKKINR